MSAVRTLLRAAAGSSGVNVGLPIAWYDFRRYDGSGTLAPRIGDKTMTLAGSPTYVAGSHVNIDGGSQYAAVPNSTDWDPDSTGAVTIIVLHGSGGYAGGKFRNLVAHRTANTTGTKGWALFTNSGSPYGPTLSYSDGSAAFANITFTGNRSGFAPTAVVIVPAGTHRIVDGTATVTGVSAQTGTYTNTARLILGAASEASVGVVGNSHASNYTSYRGLLVYNAALTTTQIAYYAAQAINGAY